MKTPKISNERLQEIASERAFPSRGHEGAADQAGVSKLTWISTQILTALISAPKKQTYSQKELCKASVDIALDLLKEIETKLTPKEAQNAGDV